MKSDWTNLCVGDDLVCDFAGVDVQFASGRSHRVLISDAGDTWELTAVVAGARAVAEIEAPLLAAWSRNRSADLIALRLDSRGRLVAGAWSPKVGQCPEDFAWLIRRLAREADRLEFTHSGDDRY